MPQIQDFKTTDKLWKYLKPLSERGGFVKGIIQDTPGIIQTRKNLPTTGRKTVSSDDNFRWNEDCTEHNLGCALFILHDQCRNSNNFEVSRGTSKLSFSTSETISKMDSTLGDRISSNSTCDQCDVEVQATNDHQLFVRGDVSRRDGTQTNFNKDSTGLGPSASASPPTRRERECGPENRGLGLQQLCREQPVGSSGALEKKLTNPTSFNFNGESGRQATLQKLSHDLEAQYSQDVPSLLNILKSFYPFNETSGDVLEDDEINDFSKLYGISNVRPILASDDNDVFWLEDTAGAIYMWSRVVDTMSYLGHELREALVNYLFHQDNICYIVEFTHEIIPKNEVERKARELADSFESIEWVVEQKKGKKGKKGRKKKNKH